MTVCYYTDRLEKENGLLVRIVTATSRKDKSQMLDIYKQFENGDCFCRNLYYSMYGYRVGFPNEVNSLYGKCGSCDFIQKLDAYAECKKINSFQSRCISECEKKLIEKKYPEFKYILKKYPHTIEKTMQILDIWKTHKEIEFVLSTGYDKVALNKSFWKLSKDKQKEICNFIRKNPNHKNFNLQDIQTVLKFNAKTDEFVVYKDFCFMNRKVSYDVYKYLCKIEKANIDGIYLYKDYHDLLVQTNHDKNNTYWKYPKDLQKKHDELREEVKHIQELEEIEKLKKKQNDYKKVVENLFKFKKVIDGYSVYVPENVEDIKLQADKLHQCLIQCDYVSQVIRKSCVLVFIRKNEEPIATVQLLSNDKIGQFYANELDRNNCLPTDEVRAVFDKWLTFKKNYKKTA